MSNVLARNRSLSQLEFYNTATDLRAELTRFVMNEKNIPKKYRYVFAIPITNKLQDLFTHITSANTYYPSGNTERKIELVEKRMDLQTEAIADCEVIYQQLQYVVDTLPININKLNNILSLLEKEELLLKGWRKSARRMLTSFLEEQKMEEQKLEEIQKKGN